MILADRIIKNKSRSRYIRRVPDIGIGRVNELSVYALTSYQFNSTRIRCSLGTALYSKGSLVGLLL
jgi:hypothetical protein